MKKRKKGILLFLCIVCGVSSFVLWTQHENRHIELKLGLMSGNVWNAPESDSYILLDNVIKAFEKKHPNVTITYESGTRPDDYEEWLSGKILNDDAPDVFFVPSQIFSTLAQNRTLQNLESYIKDDENFDASKYYEASFKEGQLEDNTYALPYESVPNLMFVNKTLLEKEQIQMPENTWTWEGFYEICKQVSKDNNGDGIQDQFGFYGYGWEDAVYSNGVTIYNEEKNSVTLDQEQIIEATTFMRKLSRLQKEKVSSEMFDKGQVAFCLMDYSDYRTYMPYPWRVKKYSSFEWDCIMMPSGPNGGNISQIDTLMIGMSSRSKEKKLAWEFMKQLSSDEAFQKELSTSAQGVSVLKEIMTTKEVLNALKKDNPGDSSFELGVVDDIMKQGVALRRTKEYEQVLQSINGQIQTLLESDQEIENALIYMQGQLNAMLHK
ncbi:ABC transporter substrate-binding protein [Amedibacillus sp. YH-ame6]